jgi:hypothetical protein
MTDKEAMNVASQCRATASADLCKNILVDGGSGFLFELLLDAAKAIETLAQEKALQALHNENERLGLYKDAYAEQEPVAWEQFWTTAPQRKWIETNNSVCAILRQAHDILATSSLPPRRKWVGLTDEEFHEACWNSYVDPVTGECSTGDREYAVHWTEAKLKEKNT